MKTLVGILVAALLVAPVVPADEVDRHVLSSLEALRVPGASVAVVRHGRIVKAGGYGLANIETGSPATPHTVYEIGSMTKQFTAAAVMMLVEERKIDLDARITRYFPEAPGWWGEITVRHLLTHTGGIQNHVAVPGYLAAFRTNLFFEDTPSHEELLGMFYALPREFEPGRTWAYDNTGYYLLGIVLEKASGRGYYDLLEERIFRPLGMSSTRSTDPRPVVPRRASGYEWVGDRWENRRALVPAIGFSAGSIASTVDDLARWDEALSAGKLLNRSSLEAMWTPARTSRGEVAPFDYGFGWFLETYGGRRDVAHSGGTPGFSSTIHRFVDDGLTVIILTNHADLILDQLALDIAEVYEPRLRPGPAVASDERTTVRHRGVFTDLLRGRVEPGAFTEPMRIHLGTATGRSFFKWYASRGELSSFVPMSQDDAGACRVFRYRVGLGAGSYRFSFRIAADGRIVQIYPW